MEKSVLLESLDKRNKLFENLVRKASIFDLSDETIAKINELFKKMDDNVAYVRDTKNIKSATLDKINEANNTSISLIKSADDYLDALLKVSVGRQISTGNLKEIEKTIASYLDSDIDACVKAANDKVIVSRNGKLQLSRKVVDAIRKLRKGEQELTKDNKEVLTAAEKVLVDAYLKDAQSNADDRLDAIQLDVVKGEEEAFVLYLESINDALTSKRAKSGSKSTGTKATDAAGATAGTVETTEGKEKESTKSKHVRKVKEVKKSTTKDVERNKKTSRCLSTVATVILLGAILLATLLTIKQCSKNCNKNDTPVDTTSEPGIETTADPVESTTEPVVVIPVIDINDETKLEEYAKYIQDELKKQDIDMSVEDIKNAIKLVNVDYLDEKPFDNREQIYNATEDAGTIATKLGTSTVIAEDPAHENNLITERTLDDMIKNVVPDFNKENLNLTKNENGYSIYELLDQLTYILEHKETYSETDRQMAAKLYNEVMARKVRTFTLTPNSSVGQYYLALGMYEAEHQNVKDLTAGRLWGPMYGDEEQIDGTYGFICVEELQKYTSIGNTNNGFYTTYADLMLRDKTLTKSLD